MLDMRSSDEAEGERRIMGSGRRADGLPPGAFVGAAGFGCEARAAGLLGPAAAGPLALGGRERRKSSAVLRTWEKS